jgi:hypothetical protein
VKINYGRLRSGRFFVSLPDGVSFEAVRELQHDLDGGRFAWVGRAADDPDSRVVIGVSGDALAGTFAYDGRLFKLEPRADGSHVVSEVETGDPAPEMDPVPVADTGTSGGTSGDASTTFDGGTVMDVLVAFTPRVESAYGTAGTEALIVQAVAESNQAYANSGVTARLNLVGTVRTDYVESGNMSTDLSRLRGNGDGYMDELHALRDDLGADLVSLIEHEPQYCGIAYRMTSLSTGFASSAFSVVHRTCATGYYSFAHEIGHNQGAHHDPANASGAMYPYAYGHQEPFGAFRTVMAYNCSGGCTRVDHFSNPNVLLGGESTGIDGAADNARTINTNAGTIAAFREIPSQFPPAAPSGLTASALDHASISLGWNDNSSDESGFRLERSTDGNTFSEIASLTANVTAFTDDSLAADTLYYYRLRAWNSAGNSAYTGVATAVTDPAPVVTEQVASGEVSVAGVASGQYDRTWSDDGVAQVIQEVESGGRKDRRYGYLEHKWQFQLQPADSLTLVADVATSASGEAFTFAYSTDDSSYVNMFTVDAASSGARQFALPASLSGTVYIRVRDTARQAGSTTHAVAVDQLVISYEGASGSGTGSEPPPPETNSGMIELGASGYKVKGSQAADLTWGGAGSGTVDIYRNGALLAGSIANTGGYTDPIDQKGGGSYLYRVCEAGTDSCSNTAEVVF